jgi:ADP-ribosyl-[dinitrogen reductase] hydrolase
LLPVALCTLGDEGATQRFIVEQAHITHNHPYSDLACQTLARMVQLAVLGHSKLRLLAEARKMVATCPVFAYTPYPGNATGYVVDTIQTVFHYFFRSRDFEGCLIDTVNAGGDADTNGAIVGMLAGAYYGSEGHPKRWLRKMNPVLLAELSTLATTLVDRSPLLAGELRVINAPDSTPSAVVTPLTHL